MNEHSLMEPKVLIPLIGSFAIIVVIIVIGSIFLSGIVKNRRYRAEFPLHFAAYQREWDSVERLLEEGADIQAKNELDVTLLHIAASQQDYEKVELLLSRDADMNAIDRFGETPLHYVVVSDADVKGVGEPSFELFHYDFVSAEKIIALLLSRGADKAIRNNSGETPLALLRKVKNNNQWNSVKDGENLRKFDSLVRAFERSLSEES